MESTSRANNGRLLRRILVQLLIVALTVAATLIIQGVIEHRSWARRVALSVPSGSTERDVLARLGYPTRLERGRLELQPELMPKDCDMTRIEVAYYYTPKTSNLYHYVYFDSNGKVVCESIGNLYF